MIKMMKKYSLIPVILLFPCLLFGQGIYNNGGKIVVGSGVTLTVSGSGGNYRNENNGSLNLSGTLKLDGNLTNNAATDVIGTAGVGSKVELKGTTAQTIGGTTSSAFTFPDLVVNNASGVTFEKDANVTGALTLTNGLVNIGNNNFTLGTATTIAGTPSASSMIVATGSGKVQKLWAGTGTFTFPVGDNTGTAEFSPVTLTFTSGTFNNAVTGVNLVNAAYNDPSITGSYLKRYWNITQSGISGFVCNAVYQYSLADVVGTEVNIASVQVLPAPLTAFSMANVASHQLITNGLTSFGTFTGGPGYHMFHLTAFLEGPFNGSNAMNTTLNANHLIPLSQPYNNGKSWSYSGTENVGTIPADVVDWILVEVRQAPSADLATSSTIQARRAGFIKSDGTIVDLDGTSPLNMGKPIINKPLFVVVRHRNHLSIMSSGALPPDENGIYNYDFSTALTQAYGSGNGYKSVASTFAMVAGDADKDGSIYVSDYNNWAVNFGKTGVYEDFDIDMDGAGFVSDYSAWANNYGKELNGGTLLKSAKLNAAINKSEDSVPIYTSSVPK